MQKRIPLRMCTGCGEMKPKKELLRIVKTPENEIALDFTGKKSGRGAYICKNVDCLKKSRKSKKLERTFSLQIPDETIKLIEETFNNI